MNQMEGIMGKLDGKKVAVLVANGFEEVELTSPVERLKQEGAEITIVSTERKDEGVKSWKDGAFNQTFDIDLGIENASESDFDALLLPGGVINPDRLRADTDAIAFIRAFYDAEKPIAAICHGPWTLIDAGVAKGKTMTSFMTLKTDLENAGAEWVDREVVVDNGLVTSRNPDDLPAFNDKLVEEIAEGKHGRIENEELRMKN